MARDDLKLQHQLNNALDHELSELELAALQEQLEETEVASQWDRLQNTDELLRTTPLAAPAPGFANRVMAAIAAMPLPAFAKRHPGLGIALGLAIAAFLTLPMFSILFLLTLSVITDPGAINTWLQTFISAASYVIGLLADIASQFESGLANTPMMLALVTTMVPVTMLWGWLLWNLLGGPHFSIRRPKS
jgi:hypothetical protein